MSMGQNPPVWVHAQSFHGVHAGWTSNQAAFVKLVSEGYPGRGMPGQSDFSNAEWSELYSYVKALTAQ
jgi:hypothetical protein